MVSVALSSSFNGSISTEGKRGNVPPKTLLPIGVGAGGLVI